MGVWPSEAVGRLKHRLKRRFLQAKPTNFFILRIIIRRVTRKRVALRPTRFVEPEAPRIHACTAVCFTWSCITRGRAGGTTAWSRIPHGPPPVCLECAGDAAQRHNGDDSAAGCCCCCARAVPGAHVTPGRGCPREYSGSRVGADGGARGAAVLNEEGSLLADAVRLEAALDACPAGGDEAAQARNKQDTMRAFAALRDEFEYQIGKGIPDPRWPDPDDANDLQLAIKKLGRALEKSVANIG